MAALGMIGEATTVKEAEYKIREYVVSHLVAPEQQLEFRVRQDWMTHNLVYQVRLFLAGKTMQEETVMWPATWWDHFKRDGIPKWFKRRVDVFRWLKPVRSDADRRQRATEHRHHTAGQEPRICRRPQDRRSAQCPATPPAVMS